ncbi:nucleosome assembly protein 1;2 [Cynara cardunculus var. scolymus]|uniref:nucleosome assembly protein 1;2 n=1 Tax=Cynara cardunculus var. scolymus TaxID=59895 RepID=UPI000D62B46A|nr:nucleosome assembly protein 1;2 [Cynara cardunculus var. scolymus]XP_024964732.1 nucleosome assembly protein 1;2 [Cynara cardunculus var. scolymus]XP_024964733.1 nucleosome assembly protein 1;2 [Cynara cardunculus var. scolymus]XP_024964734.1 nucleosome assembly protein 1;2 [Cynara cardunculus var. scolymus]
MRKSGGAGKKKQPDAIDEVEQMLRVTEDDLLLKLTVNSHTKSKSKFDFVSESSHNNAIDPDLDRRFQALRYKPSKSNPKTQIKADHEDVDNLLARFAALKAPTNATSTSNSSNEQHGKVVKDESCGVVDSEDEEDEVSKIINWAIDAARLDPSPSSDIDDDDDDADVDDDSDDDSDDDASHTVHRKKKGSKK